MLILIVGDREEERAVLRQAVTRLGHEWRQSVDGDEGWLHYLDCRPQVILSDFMMPGKNGLELCQAVRAQPFDHYTYFVMLSTLAERDHVFEGLRSGADDYLPKPVDVAELELHLLAAERVSELHRRLAEQRQELQDLSQKLLAESRKDALTQVGNRLRFHDDSPGFLACSPCTVALCDIDCFKQYNDTYGHLEGDKILKVVAHQLDRCQEATLYRFGGEEFLLVFANQEVEAAAAVLEQLRAEIEALQVVHVGNPPYGRLTVTFGLAPLQGDTPGHLEKALKEADLALYEGKKSGRNRVCRFAVGSEAVGTE
jgi:diguanylate cyclase (GGDEF)-like protein